jgi:hypothetical protein
MAAGLCLTIGACGGDDSSDSANDPEGDTNADGPGSTDDDSSSDQQNQQQTQQESECSSSSECEPVVCDCPEGPVNFQGCSVLNGVGTCATEDTCASSACD